MGDKTKTKKKLRFWRKGKKDVEPRMKDDMMSAPMLNNCGNSPTKSKTRTKPKPKSKPPPPTHERSHDTSNDANASKYNRGRPLEYKTPAARPSPDSKHTQDGMRGQSKNRSHPTTPLPQVPKTRPSSSYTPETLPPTPSPTRTATRLEINNARPSPTHTPSHNNTTKWQESDEDKKIKAMARLHNLAKEHTKSVPKGSIPAALRSIPDEPLPNIRFPRDQTVIDAVLGINPCVPMETKAVIKTYASSPTSPATVVNLKMIKEGGSKVFSLARDSVRDGVVKMMSCAADLKDLKEDNDLCYNDFSNRKKENPLHTNIYDDEVSTDDEGTFTGLSVKDGRDSPVSHLGHGISTDEVDSAEEESLGEVMERMDMKLPATAEVDVGMREHRMPIMRVSSSRGGAEIKRRANGLGAQHLQPPFHIASGAISGITSFRSLTKNSSRDSSGAPKRDLSKFDVVNANPITSNIPFDERSDVDENDDVYVPLNLYSSSGFEDNSPGRHLQLGEGNVYMAGTGRVPCGSDRGI